MSVIQPQWGLETTTNGMLQLSRELMIACTSDNVQPLAILACQQFGNTLAMSPETCRKVELLVLPSPEPITLRFLKATVGFFKDDCATHLGSNSAGVRFLALASALLNSLSLVEATKAVHAMILDTAADAMLVPTFTHLHALMKSIEGRCQRSGFTNDVVGYDILFSRASGLAEGDDIIASHDWIPTSSMISQLVDAFRQLGRIGNPEIVGLTIVAKMEAAWIVAFTKWCIGLPPTVYLGDSPEGRVLDQSRSPVNVRIPAGYFKGITIHTEYSFGAPTELLVSREGHFDEVEATFQGMISVETFGAILLARLQKAIHFVSPDDLLEEILDLMLYTLRVFRNLDPLHEELKKLQNNGWAVCSFNHLPNTREVAEAYTRLFSLKEPPNFRTWGNDAAFRLGPELSKYLLQAKCCICDSVCPPTCHCKGDLTVNITDIIVNTLCVSILKSSSDLRLYSPAWRGPVGHDLYKAVGTVIRKLRCTPGFSETMTPPYTFDLCNDLEPLSYKLLGHGIAPYHAEEIVMSSGHGQVVYPLIFGLSCIPAQGNSLQGVISGNIRLQGSTVSRVVSIDAFIREGFESTESEKGLTVIESDPTHALPPVSNLANYLPGVRVYWRMEQLQEGTILGTFSLRNSIRGCTSRRMSPSEGIRNLKQAISLESCPHDPRSNLPEVDGNAVFGGIVPFSGESRIDGNPPPGFVTVVPIAGAEDLRLFALSHINRNGNPIETVLRGRACLACCLKLCREVRAPLLLL